MLRYSVEFANKEQVRYTDLLGTLYFQVEPFSWQPVVISLDPRPSRKTGVYRLFVPTSHVEIACQRIKAHFQALGETISYPEFPSAPPA